MGNLLFPILEPPGTSSRPEYIMWSTIVPHERQAELNHGQTLERLAERGGLGWSELLAVLEDRKWTNVPPEVAKQKVLEIIRKECV